ncbi:MAG: hypothetical protein CO066_04245, partial [Comamonadaceae bacterium CG_4_9_14_0_8_um_filter_60_18]
MTDERKDLPPVNSPNFLAKLREAMQTYLGNRGDKMDRGITLRDLADAGMVEVSRRYLTGGRVSPVSGTGPAVEGTYEPDLTPPPMPTGFTATAAISNLLVESGAPNYTQGHGHAKARLYGVTWISGPLPVFADAVVITEFPGTVASYATNPATTWHLWLTWVSVDDVESPPAGGTNGVVTRTGEDVSLLLTALSGEITSSELSQALNTRVDLIDGGVPVVSTLSGSLVTLAAEQTATNQQVQQDLNSVGASWLESITTLNATTALVHDAGIYTDPVSGTVKISGVEAANDHLNTVDIRLDSAEGSIALKASTTYVDNAISTAVLDPSQVPVFSALEARISTAEVDIDSLQSTITLKAQNTDLSATNLRMTTAEENIDALEGEITLRVTNADFDLVTGGLNTRIGSAETTLTAI